MSTDDSTARRTVYLSLAVVLGVGIAGFWNAGVADGFGRNVVAGNLIGGYSDKADQFASLGEGFGFIFAIVAGLAATFTACNCVAFAMIPGLACAPGAVESQGARPAALRALGIMLLFVALVGAVYGSFVGWLGPAGAAEFNSREIRSAQASVVFSGLGLLMLLWAALEFGLLGALTRRCSPVTRAFFSQPTTKAAVMGLMVGSFAIGRPFPVFREFLLYAAQARQPVYGAAVMALQGISQVIGMVIAFLLVLVVAGRQLQRWLGSAPQRANLLSGFALGTGGAYFLFYWGIARAWPTLGHWGFHLGWYR